jgi:hypothetical protein
LAGADAQAVLANKFDADNLIQGEEHSGEAAWLVGVQANPARNVVEAFANLSEGADRRDAPVGEDDNMVGEAFEFVEFMAGDEEALAGLSEAGEEVEQFATSKGIDAAERFVEDDEGGIVDEGLSELDALAHAFGKAAKGPVGAVGHADELEGVIGAATGLGEGVAGEAGTGKDELVSRHFLVKAVVVGTEAEQPFGGGGDSRQTVNFDGPKVGSDKSSGEAQKGAFARAVGTD